MMIFMPLRRQGESNLEIPDKAPKPQARVSALKLDQ
jgi:hypothetical protein